MVLLGSDRQVSCSVQQLCIFMGILKKLCGPVMLNFVLNVFLGPCVYGCGVVYAGMGRKRKSGQESFAESVLCDLDCPKQGIVTKTHDSFIWRYL